MEVNWVCEVVVYATFHSLDNIIRKDIGSQSNNWNLSGIGCWKAAESIKMKIVRGISVFFGDRFRRQKEYILRHWTKCW